MRIFNNLAPESLDIETLAMSLALMGDVDIMRVHSPREHMRAMVAYNHSIGQFV
jgi:hypothetical protein